MSNKRGQLGISIIVAITIFLIGMAVMNIVRDEITTARLVDNLDCANSSITDGTKLTCLTVDILLPYLILIIISASIGVITARFLQWG